MLRKIILIILLPVGCIGVGVNEFIMLNHCKPKPQKITCNELCKHGCGDNAYIKLTDLYLALIYSR